LRDVAVYYHFAITTFPVKIVIRSSAFISEYLLHLPISTHAKRQGRERDSRNDVWPRPTNGKEERWRYLVHSGADKTYYDLRDMYGGHVWRRILLPMLPRSSSGYDTNWIIVDRLTKIVVEDLLRGFVEVGDKVMLEVSSWKDVVHFGKKGKLAPRYVGPFEILESIGPVAYRLKLPKDLSEEHDTFHVSNLKKCLADANLHVPLEEIKVDKTLHFVEEPVEIIDREVKSLKRSRIPIVKSIGTRSEIIRIS
ncbi:hypothetical protein Tco_0272843, partial [Tanacetum coccineum]